MIRFAVAAFAFVAACATAEAQPRRRPPAELPAIAAAVREYFEQEIPIGWSVRDVQIFDGGLGAAVSLDAPIWTVRDMNVEAAEACPNSEAFLWRSVLYVSIQVNRRGIAGHGTARCSALGRR